MRNQKNSGMSTLKLILIITGSIVAAAGIIFLILKLLKKKKAGKDLDCCCCDDEWEFDDDMLGDLRFDDEECADCDGIDAAIDDAIDAVTEE